MLHFVNDNNYYDDSVKWPWVWVYRTQPHHRCVLWRENQQSVGTSEHVREVGAKQRLFTACEIMTLYMYIAGCFHGKNMKLLSE